MQPQQPVPQQTPQPEPYMGMPQGQPVQQPLQPAQAVPQPLMAPQPEQASYVPPRPPISAIYPEPNTPQPSYAQSYGQNQAFSASNMLGGAKSGSSFALILSILAVSVFPLLIFEPGLISSMGAAAAWIIVVLGLSGASVFFALKEQKKSADVNSSAMIALVLGCIMLVMGVIFGSYYIKIQATLNSYKKSFNSRY